MHILVHGCKLLVADPVLAGRAVFRQGQEGIAVCQAPVDNPLHSIDAEALDIVLQDHRGFVLLDTVDHIIEHLGAGGSAAGIVAVHIPVVVAEALSLHAGGQPGHNAGVKPADGIGGASGKAKELGLLPGIVLDNALNFIKVAVIGFLAGIDLSEIMGRRVDGHDMTLLGCPDDRANTAGVDHKEGGLDIVLF